MIYYVANSKSKNFGQCSINFLLNYCKHKDILAVDTETEGFNPRQHEVLSWQIGDADNQFVVNNKDYPFWKYPKLFESDKLFLFQNAKFDLRFFIYKNIFIKDIYDTFLAERVLNLGRKNVRMALDILIERYCNYTGINKDIRGQIHYRGLDDVVIKYAAQDVEYLHEIRNKQLKKAEELNLIKAISLQNKYCPVLAYTESCGFAVDKQSIENVYNKYKKKAEAQISLLDDLVIKEFPKYQNKQLSLFDTRIKCTINWNSAAQIIPLFKDIGLNLLTFDKKTKKQKYSVEAPILLPQKDKHSIIPIYLQFKKFTKLYSTYGINLLKYVDDSTGRLYTQYFQMLETGRLSSGGKDRATKAEYPNLQNIPSSKEFRQCFIASPDNVLIVGDYSGQEQIILANHSLDKDLINFYNKGHADMHSFIASKIYNNPYKEYIDAKSKSDSGDTLSPQDSNRLKERKIAKAAGFAINYGGNGYTIANNLSISLEQGEEVYNSYFKAFPDLDNYFKKVKKKSWKNGYIQHNKVDRTKFFFDNEELKEQEKAFTQEFWAEYRWNKEQKTTYFETELRPKVSKYFRRKAELERLMQNYPVQGSAASITKLAGYLFYQDILNKNLINTVKLCNHVHDEIVVESPKIMGEEIKDLLKFNMEKAGSYYCKTIKLTASPKITKYWDH